jgi:hypothetical protein
MTVGTFTHTEEVPSEGRMFLLNMSKIHIAAPDGSKLSNYVRAQSREYKKEKKCNNKYK